MTKQLLRCVLALFGIIPWTANSAARADPIVVVVPNHVADSGGNVNNVIPFATPTTFRYQQVYAAPQFPLQPLVISTISFRSEGSGFQTTFKSIQFNLSTTSRAPGALSRVFQENIGNDDTLVFSGPLSLSSSTTAPPGRPLPFEITIPIADFPFDPRRGNLLLDIRKLTQSPGDAIPAELDAHFGQFDREVGTVTSRAFAEFDVSASTADSADSIALVTQFTGEGTAIAPTPEPASLLLIATGILGLARRGKDLHRTG